MSNVLSSDEKERYLKERSERERRHASHFVFGYWIKTRRYKRRGRDNHKMHSGGVEQEEKKEIVIVIEGGA